MKRSLGLLTVFVAGAVTASGQTVVLRDAGPGDPGRILRAALAKPYVVINARGEPVALRRDTSFATTVIVISPRATVASQVAGDVIVVGGDLFLHPGGRISGDAIAVGGGAYNSTLASVQGERISFRDVTYDVERSGDTLLLSHRQLRSEHKPPLLSWPLGVGLRIPRYNRVDGVAVPFGPTVTLAGGRVMIDPVVTYRSHLGNFDPGATLEADMGRVDVTVQGSRGTFSNDKWIRGDLMNSLSTLVFGADTRNYYRADRFEAKVAYDLLREDLKLEPFVGWLLETRSWSTGTQIGPDNHVFSLFGKDEDGTERPNPAVDGGRINSVLVGARLEWSSDGFTSRLDVRTEVALDAGPTAPLAEGGRFTQTTLDGKAAFPTFGSQKLELKSHAVLTGGDRPPSQRFAYLGGSGTLPTLELLEMGGDQLFFFDAAYVIPIERFKFKFVGSPQVTLRFITGSAGIGELPDFVQNVGVRVGFPLLGVEYLIDPDSRKTKITLGFSGLR